MQPVLNALFSGLQPQAVANSAWFQGNSSNLSLVRWCDLSSRDGSHITCISPGDKTIYIGYSNGKLTSMTPDGTMQSPVQVCAPGFSMISIKTTLRKKRNLFSVKRDVFLCEMFTS